MRKEWGMAFSNKTLGRTFEYRGEVIKIKRILINEVLNLSSSEALR
jgi:hypothetical protein